MKLHICEITGKPASASVTRRKKENKRRFGSVVKLLKRNPARAFLATSAFLLLGGLAGCSFDTNLPRDPHKVDSSSGNEVKTETNSSSDTNADINTNSE